jgi:hypothetical protein
MSHSRWTSSVTRAKRLWLPSPLAARAGSGPVHVVAAQVGVEHRRELGDPYAGLIRPVCTASLSLASVSLRPMIGLIRGSRWLD